ncbi:tetratricopeptide repeat protein [Chamaesiphon minutus]|uniref:Tetratricopeptide repeat protein n=1 Tax=Chamaesiphon minutus (strain ATCC 27169 / PCC 6605) TaxID=1173020 RepID=K9ULK8_CHAP6|nr:tetratricopeptide repeat protein [Chamaesiphon minutus]AFY95301.1 tetratricopeptide repeat protein [Chamaesiphon minutus PCC 6605]
MSDSLTKLTTGQTLYLPKQQIDTQVQKLCQQGNDSAFRGEHERAIDCYTSALALDASCVPAYCARGDSWLERKNYRQAEADYLTALKLSPVLAVANGGLAKVYYATKDYPAALEACTRAIHRDPENLDLYHSRALINKKLGDDRAILVDCKFILEQQPSDISARWLNARAHFQLGSYQLAIFNFDRYLNLQTEDFYAYYYRGICCERLGNFTQATIDLDRAIAIEDDLAILYRRRGRIRQQLGDFTGAMADYDRAIELDPEMAQAYSNRADIYINRGDYPRALLQCNQAIRLNPRLTTAHYQRGVINTEVGNLHAALADYHRLVQIDPQDINAYIQRSWIYFRHGEYPAVMEDCERVLSLDRNSIPANYLMGVVQSLSGFKQEAIFSLTKVMDYQPSFICALYHRGLLHHDLKNESKAMSDFALAQEIQNLGLDSTVNRDETGLYAEGLALYHMGQPDTAKVILHQAALVAQKLKSAVFHRQIAFTIEALGME